MVGLCCFAADCLPLIVRQKCKEVTALLADEEKLKAERAKNRAGNGTRSGMGSRQSSRNNLNASSTALDTGYYNEDSELQKALEASKKTAEEDEKRRQAARQSDEDLQRALSMSEQELRSKTQQEQ